MSLSDLRTRKATTGDVDAIVELNAEMAREMEGKALDVARLEKGVAAVVGAPDDRLGFYVVAEVSGDVAGVLHVTYEWSPWRNATFWWIANVFVRRGWRRRGVYTAMHGFVEAGAAADPGVCGIRLFTTAENHGAQRAYGSVGMTSEAAFFCEVDYVFGS